MSVASDASRYPSGPRTELPMRAPGKGLRPWFLYRARRMLGVTKEVTMTALVWLAAVLMFVAAVFLVTGIGASALWIAVITAGIATVVIDRTRGHRDTRA
jgi:hypothetical protein